MDAIDDKFVMQMCTRDAPVLPKVPMICPLLNAGSFADVALSEVKIFGGIGIVVFDKHIVTVELIVARLR